MAGKPPKGQKHPMVLHLLSHISSNKINFFVFFTFPFHFYLGCSFINTAHLLWEVLEKHLKVLAREEEATVCFREIVESGLRLDNCDETVLETEDLTTNSSLRELTPFTSKVLSHLQTHKDDRALT